MLAFAVTAGQGPPPGSRRVVPSSVPIALLCAALALGAAGREVAREIGAGGPVCPFLGGEMVFVPAGAFRFGPGGERRELPGYCIDRTEVSAAAFRRCVAAGVCRGYEDWPLCRRLEPSTPHQCRDDRSDAPANWVDWYRAEQFCRWAGKRLPTAEEWEKAARGSDGRVYPWGDEMSCDRAHVARGSVFSGCRGHGGLPDRPVSVLDYADVPSPYGAIQLIGNVREWVDHRADPALPAAADASAESRGGAWREGGALLAAFARDRLLGPGIATEAHGVRCAAPPLAPETTRGKWGP